MYVYQSFVEMKWVYSFQIWFQKFTIVENMAVKDNENKWGKFWESLSLHLVERNHQHRPPQSTIFHHLKPSPPAQHRPPWSTTTSSNNHHHNQPLPPATNKDHHRAPQKVWEGSYPGRLSEMWMAQDIFCCLINKKATRDKNCQIHESKFIWSEIFKYSCPGASNLCVWATLPSLT